MKSLINIAQDVIYILVLISTFIVLLYPAKKFIQWIAGIFTIFGLAFSYANTKHLLLEGMPDVIPAGVAAPYRRVLLHTVSKLSSKAKSKDIKITVGTEALLRSSLAQHGSKDNQANKNIDTSIEVRAQQYEARPPLYHFPQLVVPKDVEDELLSAIGTIEAEQKAFDEWGLRAIEQFTSIALNFRGQPGTGKTLAAHALAHKLDRPIIAVSYAELEGKYVGDGPKNVQAIFYAAIRDNAVLLIDDADTLLSRGLTDGRQVADQYLNALISQLLVCLANFQGVVIFATSLVENYDKAFETRIRHINFPMPDEAGRNKLWQILMPSLLPVAEDVSAASLAAQVDDICGRDIKNAIFQASIRVVRDGRSLVEMRDLLHAIRQIKSARIQKDNQANENIDTSIEVRARQYEARPPLYHFSQLVVPDDVKDELLSAIGTIQAEQKVFDEWGLRAIEPFPSTALNFHGQPGTGKTLAAHALANKLGQPILVASYAEIEGKFVGDGPKNVQAIFYAAARDNAVLFIDEADTLLSRRLTNVRQAADQSLNSLSSQMLVCLANFRGVVIFATNLVENYDKAFETRIRHVYFPMPDEASRRELWQTLMPSLLPLAEDVSVAILAAQVDDICGRDIKNAIVQAAVRVHGDERSQIEMKDLLNAIRRIKNARIPVNGERINGEQINDGRINGERVNGERINGERVNDGRINGERVNGERIRPQIPVDRMVVETEVRRALFSAEQGRVNIANNHRTRKE